MSRRAELELLSQAAADAWITEQRRELRRIAQEGGYTVRVTHTCEHKVRYDVRDRQRLDHTGEPCPRCRKRNALQKGAA